ncbi:MAG: PilZ domain-containing protein [Gammaproteobacteria bacterium]|jgi:hypothetical protein|nr:PilZ domain-containing protein [Gammaproteobacteria bacterium]
MDHRRFSRILFSSDAKLLCKEQTFSTEVLDLSLKGALVKRPLQWDIAIGSKVILQFQLNDSELVLRMETIVVHSQQDSLGLRCEKIDIESASHLRRLLELNMGDAELLSRELDELSN